MNSTKKISVKGVCVGHKVHQISLNCCTSEKVQKKRHHYQHKKFTIRLQKCLEKNGNKPVIILAFQFKIYIQVIFKI